jgi:hypothetical protein
MIHVIVSKDGIVVSKDCLAGDDQTNTTHILNKAANDLEFSYQIVDEDTFDSTPHLSPDELEWSTIKTKGSDAIISFLANKLGYK